MRSTIIEFYLNQDFDGLVLLKKLKPNSLSPRLRVCG